MKDDAINIIPMVKRPFSIDTFGTFFSSMIASILSVPISIILARFLGPEGKGVVTLVLLVIGQLTAILTFGVEIALVYYAGRQLANIEKIGNAAMGLGILLGSIGVLLGMTIFKFGLNNFLPNNLLPILILMTSTIPMALITTFLRNLIRVTGRIIEEGMLSVMAVFLNLVIISAAFLAGFALKGVLVAFWLSSILLALLVIGFGIHWKILDVRSKFTSSLWKPLIHYGIKLHLGSIFQSLNYRFDVYLVAFFLGSASVGWYSISVAMAEWLWLLPKGLGATLMQRSATIKEEEVNTISGPINRLTSGLLLIGTVLLGSLGKWIIQLFYGKTFIPSFYPFLLLLPGIWAMGLWKNFMNDLAVRGYPTVKSYTSGIALVLTLGLDILLIPLWGLEGAAMASSAAYISAFLVALRCYCKITGFHPLDLLVIRRCDINQLKKVLKNGLAYLYAKSATRREIKLFNE